MIEKADSTPLSSGELILASQTVTLPLDQNPAAIYLASLRPIGRRGMQRALTAIVETITGQTGDPLTFPWHTLRFQHTQALRAKLAEPSNQHIYSTTLRMCVPVPS